MPLHLIKLSVGTDSVKDLEDWIRQKLKQQKKAGKKKPERVHTLAVTRSRPAHASACTKRWSRKFAEKPRE